MTFHWIDIFLIIILGLFALIGFVKGFTQRVLSLLSWGGAIFGTFKLYPLTRPFIVHHIAGGTTATVLTSAFLFVTLLLLLKLITTAFSNLIQRSPLKGLDRLLGMVFGLGIGAFVLCLFGIIVQIFVPQSYYPKNLQNSILWPWITKGQTYIEDLSPLQKKDIKAPDLFKTVSALTNQKPAPQKEEAHYDQKERSQLDKLIAKNT
jgi:membrane protein required for colicin V production